MRPSYKIGKTRIQIAEILSDYLGKYIAPALVEQNYGDYRNGRNLGFAYSWYLDNPDIGCGIPMKDFMKMYKSGNFNIIIRDEEVFLERKPK
jgi:hypothetical protein